VQEVHDEKNTHYTVPDIEAALSAISTKHPQVSTSDVTIGGTSCLAMLVIRYARSAVNYKPEADEVCFWPQLGE
jgi:hypothetical protein